MNRGTRSSPIFGNAAIASVVSRVSPARPTSVPSNRSSLDEEQGERRALGRMRNLMRLYTGLIHDIHAPLNTIVLNLEMLERSLAADARRSDGTIDESVSGVERLEIIKGEMNRLQRTLGVLLGQTAPESAEVEVFDARLLMRELGRLLEAQVRQPCFEFVLEGLDTPAPVRAGRDRIMQALLNVALNGLDAMPFGGTLRLELEVGDEAVSVRIGDTGQGVEPLVRERIFDLHVSNKPDGTGAGLHVTRSILDDCGGSVELTETSKKGTLFTVTLPLAEPMCDSAPADRIGGADPGLGEDPGTV